MKRISHLTSRVIHPLLLGSMSALHIGLLAGEFTLTVSTYLPIIVAASIVAILESALPYRNDWRPNGEDIKTDLLYMGIVQLALPKLLAFTAALLALQLVDYLQIAMNLWPHEAPVAAQVVLLVLLTSFVRYWVHRVSHQCHPLWRVHAVHHSADKLYWLNLTRFHPLEATLRFLTESLPFILLGVHGEVLSIYFVLLSVNGFLLHSNVRLKHGILNHIFATAELHRWHHVQDPTVAACNYGNLLIIWDSLFGTRYLPPQREVGSLGLRNKQYPRRFALQIVAPFISGSAGSNMASRQGLPTRHIFRAGR